MDEAPRRSRSRGRLIGLGVVALVAVVAAGSWLLLRGRAEGTAAQNPKPPTATATVDRQDLVQTQSADGTLGFGTQQRLSGDRKGMITWLPAVGTVITRDHTLYKINNEPVRLMYGTTPLYRTLKEGISDGPDVLELERNLAALGYSGFKVNDQFTWATANAVSDWQDDHGLDQTGELSSTDVIMADGAIRVSDLPTDLGQQASAGRPVLSYTETEPQVTVPLDIADIDLAHTGDKVSVELPDGSTTPGKITDVADQAKTAASGSSDSSDSDTTVDVTIALDHPSATHGLTQAPVTVDFRSDVTKNVLTVPVAALLARPGGGYGVQVVTAGTTKIVPVQTGAFADTRVQISGDGISEGTTVGVPAR